MSATMVPLTARMAQDQRRAMREGKAMTDAQNQGNNTLEAQDFGPEAGYVIYVYNILDKAHLIQQPPLFPGFPIPACPKGQKYSFTLLPAFVNEPFMKPGTTEYYYKRRDGRSAANSLVNPSAYPSTSWNAQTAKWETGDQFGNNLNAVGVWWSLTMPEEVEELDKEIKIFRDRLTQTMNDFVKTAEALAAGNDLKSITPWHHFAMDYLGKQAAWHMSTRHMITCPNCGDPVMEGISYHRNAFGEKCIIDRQRYLVSIGQAEPEPEPVFVPAAVGGEIRQPGGEAKLKKQKPRTKLARPAQN